jgi:hypothetical protein
MPIEFNDAGLIDSGAALDFEQMLGSCLMDLSKEVGEPPKAITIGGKTFGSYGDFSGIVAPSKAKKTFLKSLLTAAYSGGEAHRYCGNIIGHDNRNKYIIEFDTEQSRYHSYRVFKRVEKMVGRKNPFYVCFYLREHTPPERTEFINWVLTESKYATDGQGIGLVIIDGIADLMYDTNSLPESNIITTKLLKWSGQANCHIITVLHQTFQGQNGASKPTGHLGSSVLKKAETVVFLENEGEFTTVKAKYTRNSPFADFRFTVTENDYLPRMESSSGVLF